MGFAIWLKDVIIMCYNWHSRKCYNYNDSFLCLSIGYQHTEAVGSLQDWDLTLHPDCQHKIEYHCFYHFNVYATGSQTLVVHSLSKSVLVGDGSGGTKNWFLYTDRKGQNNKLSYRRQ